MDDSENAKISDSAYSNSCSNSQSRRSHSSKSTHSGSHSSGSSGYGGKPSTSGSSNILGQPPKKDKESKKKKLSQTEPLVPDVKANMENRPPEQIHVFVVPTEESSDVVQTALPPLSLSDTGVENMDISTSEMNNTKNEIVTCTIPPVNTAITSYTSGRSPCFYNLDGFSCVISMHDDVVMYTTASITTTLGFPKEMWIGRSFIDFVHPKDRSTFASQITTGVAVPKLVNSTQHKAQSPPNSVSTMVCRLRRYRGLTTGFGVRDKVVTFMPFLLKLTFKNISDEEGKVIYLVIQATPFYSAFKIPNEVVTKGVPFVLRHAANGAIEYVDPDSVPYLGYLPQDLAEKDALQLYHPEDLCYLRHVYETIVKEGGLPRCKPYRMITQNGDCVKLETEWSSFINPWSKKLEFVIGKHHILEGPSNPDVFYASDNKKPTKVTEQEDNQTQALRESIIRIMNEVLTKPAEMAKQQMSKRCQDLASFMESLMEDQPKTDEELRLEIQEPDHSYFERDSVMLGGISPHHEYNDSKSSGETPLSYNQLNFNETLQRYFNSHQRYSYEDYNTATGENILGLKDQRLIPNVGSSCLSPMAHTSGDSGELTSSCESSRQVPGSGSTKVPSGDHHTIWLTETLISKHNTEMEKELMKIHRGTRCNSKGDRVLASNETRKKKKEHLARCNASFQPTTAFATPADKPPQGVKRASANVDEPVANKLHCSSRRCRNPAPPASAAVAQPCSAMTSTVATMPWPTTAGNNINAYVLGVGLPQQMPVMSPLTAMPNMFPMYYAQSLPHPMITNTQNPSPGANLTELQSRPVPCMMYGPTMYGAPFMYSPQVSYPTQPSLMAQPMESLCTESLNPLSLANRNYEEACKPTIVSKTSNVKMARCDKLRPESQGTSFKTDNESASSTKALNRSTEAVPDAPLSLNETTDKTDGESSYSSFYSSFFKTETGSAEESGDGKKSSSKGHRSPFGVSGTYFAPRPVKKVARRKPEPPWMEQVCVTSELVYKYQVLTKTMDEVLLADKQKMARLEQPSLVNEQLDQLYLDLQLEGVAARLTLEEGITSSSSSGEDTATMASMGSRRKREYSKLVMIYEEDAPLPPPAAGEQEDGACNSTS